MPKVLLAILDGLGLSDNTEVSAFTKANTPVIDNLFRKWPHSRLGAGGSDVGLPDGQFGNSEVGHLNIGAGRIVWQELSKINNSISNGDFFQNPALLESAKQAKKKNKVHIMGLFSDGGVHSHMDHLIALLRFFKKQDIENVYVHAFTDGRDTSPHGGMEYVRQFEREAEAIGVGKIVSVVGRYYAMDRDKRWDRTEKAYKLLTEGKGEKFNTAEEAFKSSYDANITDEFIDPAVIDNGSETRIEKDDALVFFNIRGDRAREITTAFTVPGFDEFETVPSINLHYTCFTSYDETFTNVKVAFPPRNLNNTLGEVISKNNLRQLRIAETEKYPHVTYFFNGGDEEANPGEERLMVPSPKVATYDLQPEMSAEQVTDALIDKMTHDDFELIILNYANPDMVGHTGDMEATIKAIETIDACMKRVLDTVISQDYKMIVISDHGNADKMMNEDGSAHTAHTLAPVPFIVVNDKEVTKADNGILADVAPSILKLLKLQQPSDMEGKPLF
ncbi:MAG: 2,3-bisphosphoglycerate-independent phosphoglycerate mutase [Balneolales bacterium]